MQYLALILSMVTSTLLVIILKYFSKFNINTFQAIVFNYIVCSSLGLAISDNSQLFTTQVVHQPWFYAAIILGCCFIGLFNLMGWTAQQYGLTAVSVANKLSLIIPVTLAFILYNEKITALKIVGILIALPAVYLATHKEEAQTQSRSKSGWIFTLILFLGSGFNDSVVNFTQKNYLQASQFSSFVILIFGVAALIGICLLLYKVLFMQEQLALRNILGGIVLGVPNYFSMYFLVKALAVKGWDSSAVFTINNVGILLLSAACGWIIFNEKFSLKNIIGIILACTAILLLMDRII